MYKLTFQVAQTSPSEKTHFKVESVSQVLVFMPHFIRLVLQQHFFRLNISSEDSSPANPHHLRNTTEPVCASPFGKG